MDKKQLDKKLDSWIQGLSYTDRKSLLGRLSSLHSIYPFNEYEYRLMYLLNKKIITFNEYEKLRSDYINANPYLHLYNLSPRVFGEIWAQQHIIDINPKLLKPSKIIDKNYSGDYDICLPKEKKIIKIEIKASRAINTKIRGGLETKALSFSSQEPYWMNFQQLKLDIADVFIFVGVWVDKIFYWVFSNEEIKNHPTRSHQHRGGVEYQIGITEKSFNDFKKFLTNPNQLIEVIKKKSKN